MYSIKFLLCFVFSFPFLSVVVAFSKVAHDVLKMKIRVIGDDE